MIVECVEAPCNEKCNQIGCDCSMNRGLLSQRSLGQTTVLALCGRLDSESSAAIEPVIMEGAQSSNKVVLDFAGVSYVSSAGLRVILMAAKHVQQSKGVFALCSLSPEVQKIFETSGLVRILRIFRSPEEAAEKLDAL